MQIICDSHPELVELYNRALLIALSKIETPQQVGWKKQMCCMPDAGKIWQWDSCFMALFSHYSDGLLQGMNNLDNLYLCQRDDGFMAMAYEIETAEPAYGNRINPPLFAWAEWEYYRTTGDASRFERVFPVLSRYYLWLKNHRRREGSGLYFFEDSGSTGMDNAPRAGWHAIHLDGSDVCHVDLISQQLLSARCLSKMAGVLDDGQKTFFAEEIETLKGLINKHHWSERTGFYYDVFNRGGGFAHTDFPYAYISSKTVAGFWPLLAEAATAEQADMLETHLLNPQEFFTPHPVPSISRDDPNYFPEGMYWRGGVWAPTNYMITEGLKRYGKYDTAGLIALKHLEALIAVEKSCTPHTLWECYSPEYMLPANREDSPQVRSDFVGWTGLGPIAMFINTLLGISLDVPSREIHWNPVIRNGKIGIKDLQFGSSKISLLAKDGKFTAVNSDQPLKIYFMGQLC